MNAHSVELRGVICMSIHIVLTVEQEQGKKLEKVDLNKKMITQIRGKILLSIM